MQPTNAAELLYDSEITLRMVDDALDELGSSEADALHPNRVTTRPLADGGTDDERPPCDPEIFWQIEEALEEIRAARTRVAENGAAPGPEHALLLAAQLASTEARLARLARRLARQEPRPADPFSSS